MHYVGETPHYINLTELSYAPSGLGFDFLFFFESTNHLSFTTSVLRRVHVISTQGGFSKIAARAPSHSLMGNFLDKSHQVMRIAMILKQLFNYTLLTVLGMTQ